MQLFFVPGSPYARAVRVALRETGLDARVPEQEVTLRDTASTLLAHNPVGRVPTLLLDDGAALSETLLILPYLDLMHIGPRIMPAAPAGIAELGRAIGILDGIAVWNRELRRPENERSPAVIALETTRANRVADTLEHAVQNGAYIAPPPAAQTILLACALGYCERRHTTWKWRVGRPALSAWFDRTTDRPSFQATIPPPSGL